MRKYYFLKNTNFGYVTSGGPKSQKYRKNSPEINELEWDLISDQILSYNFEKQKS